MKTIREVLEMLEKEEYLDFYKSPFTEQRFIDSYNNYPEWARFFLKRQYLYLKNVINGLLLSGDDSVNIQYGVKHNIRYFHIYEPYAFLNEIQLSNFIDNCKDIYFSTPSVVTLGFLQEKLVVYYGYNNGYELFNNDMRLKRICELPRNKINMTDIDFWHFVDNVTHNINDVIHNRSHR